MARVIVRVEQCSFLAMRCRSPGNAGAGNTHLHFSIWLVTDPKRYWDGVNINPYPILISTGEGK